jgi:negative regulator of flagellin synthesis FlgM
MPTKISGLSGSLATSAALDAGRPAEKSPDANLSRGGSSAPEGSSSGTSDVHITDSASQLATLEQTLLSLPAVDGARVGQLQTAIEQGTYTVQPQHVADQLIQLEQSLAELPGG